MATRWILLKNFCEFLCSHKKSQKENSANSREHQWGSTSEGAQKYHSILIGSNDDDANGVGVGTDWNDYTVKYNQIDSIENIANLRLIDHRLWCEHHLFVCSKLSWPYVSYPAFGDYLPLDLNQKRDPAPRPPPPKARRGCFACIENNVPVIPVILWCDVCYNILFFYRNIPLAYCACASRMLSFDSLFGKHSESRVQIKFNVSTS